MPDGIEISQDFAPLCALIDVLESSPSRAARGRALARIQHLQSKAQDALQQQAEHFASLYLAAFRERAAPEEVERGAGIVGEKGRAQADRLVPEIEALRQKLAARGESLDAELRHAFQASIDIAIDWLALYENTCKALTKLAAERRGTDPEVLRARPVAGEIDYPELIRDTIARFPKILAALAK